MLTLQNISKSFDGQKTWALDSVSLFIKPGETLGIIGESGSGKTTLARILAQLMKPDKGEVIFQNFRSNSASHQERKQFQYTLGYVFQDPYSSLNPSLNIETILREPFVIQKRECSFTLLEEWMQKVKLSPSDLLKKPSDFSGGQRQRIAIARALIHQPDLVIFDEAVSSLDVSVQAQVLQLIMQLTESITVLFIGHDLPVVHYVSDRIAVLHHGKLVEFGDAGQIFHDPRATYTRKLIESRPRRLSY